MKILSIDQSLNSTGYCIWDNGLLYDFGVIKPPKDLEQHIKLFHTIAELERIIKEENISTIILEGLSFASSSISVRILDWNLQRGHLSYDASTEIDNYTEEIGEGVLAKELFDEALTDDEKCKYMQEYIDSFCDRYVFGTGFLAKSYINNQLIEGQLLEYYQEFVKIPNIVKELGFDFVKCMDECLKEISSRKQDPSQKLKWESQGGSLGEKWQKDLNQNPDTLYKADYKKGRIKECCK